jgi:hypothetical protein
MRRVHCVCLTLLILTGALTIAGDCGQEAEGDLRNPWNWTIEERLALRFEPGSFGRDKAGNTPASDKAANPREISYSIDGHLNPELLLPHELFDGLAPGLHPDEQLRNRHRSYYTSSIKEFGLDPDLFWNTLGSISGEYLLLRYGLTGTAAGGVSHVEATAEDLCRARYQAMDHARQIFGSARFDRFLYTVIGPSVRKATVTNEPNPAEALRRVEEGCKE